MIDRDKQLKVIMKCLLNLDSRLRDIEAKFKDVGESDWQLWIELATFREEKK